MEFQYIFNILVVILFIFIIFKKSNENYTNISNQDLEGLQNLSSMYKNGELKIAKLHVTDNAQFDKDINTKQNIVFNNGNNWIIHAPNDHRHQLYIAPSTGKNNGNWDWGKGLDWHSSGKMHIQDIHTRGNSTTAGKINCNNLHVNDYMYTNRLDIKAKRGTTHFNHDNKGKTYFRDDIGDTADLVKFGNNFYLFQIDGHVGNRYIHGHQNHRIGVADNKYKTKFRIDK